MFNMQNMQKKGGNPPKKKKRKKKTTEKNWFCKSWWGSLGFKLLMDWLTKQKTNKVGQPLMIKTAICLPCKSNWAFFSYFMSNSLSVSFPMYSSGAWTGAPRWPPGRPAGGAAPEQPGGAGGSVVMVCIQRTVKSQSNPKQSSKAYKCWKSFEVLL